MKPKIPLAAGLIAITMTAACASTKAYRDGKAAEETGRWDAAVLSYGKAVDQYPSNPMYKIAFQRAKLKASQMHFEKGKVYRNSGRPDMAVVELEQAVLLDPTNQYAETELRKAHEDHARKEAERNSETPIQAAKRKARGSRAILPILDPKSNREISLNFPQPKSIKQIYQSLAAAAGINVIFDPDLKDDNVAIILNNVEFRRALETLMRQEGHFYKVIDETTILIAQDTPQNRKTYEDLVIRTFYLSNADATEVANSLRSLLQSTRIYPNKADNSITLRDTADKVAVAERIIEQNDKQLAEVVIDVELLQINTTKAEEIGLVLSRYFTSALLVPPGGTTDLGAELPAGTFSWDQIKDLSIRSFGFLLPSLTYNLIKGTSAAELLAKPQLRISEGKKAQLVIGDKIPIPVTSFNTSNTVGTNVVPITSFQYQDVGIKIDVEPRVHHNREVTLKLIVEVSQVTGFAPAAEDQQPQPIIGTRTIASEIRLKDGETNFLAGLYRTDASLTKTTIPFLGDIPVLGRLVSNEKVDNKATDLVLTLTPHIIRVPDVTEADLQPLYVGTDQNISFQGTPRIETPGATGPFDAPRPAQPPGQARPPQQPSGLNLAPGGAPSDLFKPPAPQPTQSPREMIPPQPQSASPDGTSAAQPQAAAFGAAPVGGDTSGVLLGFEPAVVTLAPGEIKTVQIVASGTVLASPAQIVARFDPSVVTATAVRALPIESGLADGTVATGVASVSFREAIALGGRRVLAEITLRGVALGRTTLSFQREASGGHAYAEAVAEVR
jgi:general secretion pathway protein D